MEHIKSTITKTCNKYAIEIVLSAVCLLISCLPAMSPEIPFGHDISFHLARIEWLAESIKCGQFPAMVEPGWLNGMGYAVGVFYGDLVLYPAAVLRIMGGSLHVCYVLEVIIINLLTLVCSYHVFQTIFPFCHAGIAGTVVYMMTVYRMADLYTRGAFAEAAAFSFLPLVVLGVWKIYRMEKAGYLWLALGMTLLIQTHLITALLSVIFLVLYYFLRFREALRGKVLAETVKAIVLTILMNLYFFIPLLQYAGEVVSVNAAENIKDMSVYGLFPGQLFTLGYEANGWIHSIESMKGEMPQTIGLTLLLGISASFYVLLKAEYDEHSRLTVFNLLICFLGLYASSLYMPYDTIERKWAGFYHVLQYIQFPARILIIVAIVIPLLILYSYRELLRRSNKQTAFLFVVVVIGVSLFQGLDFIGEYCATTDMVSYDSRPEEISIPDNNWEYIPQNAVKDELNYSVISSEGTKAAILQHDGLDWLISVDANGDAESWVDLPILYYPGYFAQTGTGSSFSLIDNGKGQIRLLLGEDYHGQNNVQITYRQPILWRLTQIISLLTIIALVSVNLISAKASQRSITENS